MRRALLLATISAALIAGACGHSSSGSAELAGRVHDTGNASIAAAHIAADGSTAQTAADGKFTLSLSSGRRRVVVTATGYYPLDSNVNLAPGMNAADFTLIACAVGDTACLGATPTPTASPTPSATPTAPPNANILLAYAGSNWPGPGNNPPAWTGTARNTTTGRIWGDGGNMGNNYGLTECYKDAAESAPLANADTSAMIHHCWVDWYLFNGATNTGMGYQDAFVELYVDGATWRIAAPDATAPATIRCSVQIGNCSLKYYEVAPGPVVTLFATATAGVADIELGGFKAGQAVRITNGAFTGLDFP